MKKLISLLLVFGLLLTFCACNQNPSMESDSTDTTDTTPAGTEETLPFWQDMLKDPNAVDFDKIDENVPENGEYQIHTKEGLMNIYKYPDAKFKLLRDIDLEGAEWKVLENFTGTLNGQTFRIMNFTISEPDANGNQALIGVNEGSVMNVNLENVTITTTEKTVNAGAVVAVNKGIVRRNGAIGELVIEKAADAFNAGGAVAVNEAIFETQTGSLNITCSAPGKGNIGGLVGLQQGGKFKNNMAEGTIEVTNGTDKLVGMFCGNASNVEITDSGFAGATRNVDDQLLEAFCGAEANVTNTGWTLRDPVPELPANVMEKRQRVVDEMYEMANIVWTVTEPLTLGADCGCCGDVTFMPGWEMKGVPYNHKNGSLQRMEYYLEEGNVMPDWVYESDAYDGWDNYIGNDCSTAFQQAIAVVCNDCELMRSRDQFPELGYGTSYAVGGWDYSLLQPEKLGPVTVEVVKANGEDFMLECYAQLRLGDGIGSIVSGGGHCRMAMSDPVVMRGEDGKIDPNKSYIYEAEQVASFTWVEDSKYYSSWRQKAITFQQMLEVGMLPLTWAELNTDEPMVTPEATVENGVDGKFGLITGTVTCNVNLDAVIVEVTDENGNEVMNNRIWTTADKRDDEDLETSSRNEDRIIRHLPKSYDLGNFSPAFTQVQFEQGKTYNAKIIALTNSGVEVVAKELTFQG